LQNNKNKGKNKKNKTQKKNPFQKDAFFPFPPFLSFFSQKQRAKLMKNFVFSRKIEKFCVDLSQ